MGRHTTVRKVFALVAGALICTIFAAAGLGNTAAAREQVAFAGKYRPGTIVVDTSERRLYLVQRQGKAIRYTVAVGKAGKAWQGSATIRRKAKNPTWAAPAAVRRDFPSLPAIIPPGPRNPLGVAALVLSRAEYAIHGTNRPGSIGKAVSYGCIRMHNRDIADLYDRVRIGTKVIVRP
ncbi:MAG: L,D-transpeptidase [Alphaproteobacteria bacterium]